MAEKEALVVPRQEDKILLVRRSASESYSGYWEFPSGGIGSSESAKEAALRELEEETSLTGEVIRDSRYSKDEVHRRLFMAEIDSGQEVELSEEHDRYRWIKPDKIDRLKTYHAEKILEILGVEDG